ncbi:hypothetical protein ACHAWU_001194 [Discostella pseudostelligera]|jgi:hypothetical protein|uniref:Uncharacterized protein n=1 Tax=Discostella pseudostelligera TaxID=259834 RepID=A0ABD3M8V6_9STRA
MSEEEKKKKTPDDLLKAGLNLPALYLQAKTNINELQRMVTVVQRGKALIIQKENEKKRAMETIQHQIKTMQGEYCTLQHQQYNDHSDEMAMQAVQDLLLEHINAKQEHYQQLGILPSDSMDEDYWMSILNHKYFDRMEALKEKEAESSVEAADPAGARKMDSTDDTVDADDDNLHHASADTEESNDKAALVTPLGKAKNPKKKAKK